ncbi:MAG: hypothetical protein RIA69_11630 [Cyclobacteriaceae bacterium]
MKGNLHKSPFKFLDSYSEEDSAIFYGRDQEIEELYSKVFQSKLMLVYGASGTGKSSVINCGLANKFDSADWMPIHIRRGGNILRSLANQVSRAAIMPVDLPEESIRTSEDFRKQLSSLYLDHFKPIHLIFDQFEELFIFGFEQEWRAFIAVIRDLMDTDLDVRFIFVIRGEYLEFLSEFEEFIPEFFDNRVRIEKMTRKNAVESITKPARLFNIQLEDGFEENLLKKISPEKTYVELTFLQVFLDKVYREARLQAEANQQVVMTKQQIDAIGQLGDVLAEFVDEQLFKMSDTKAALTVLKSFVSLQGTKTQMTSYSVQQYTKEIGHSLSPSVVDQIISELVNKRILKEQDENGQFELRHDSLAQKIYQKITIQEREILDIRQFINNSFSEYLKRGTLLTDEDLVYIAPFERHLSLDQACVDFIQLSKKKSAKRKKRQRIRIVIIGLIVLLSMTSLVGFFFSQEQKKRAENMAIVAKQKSEEAENQRGIAEEQKKQAKKSEELAIEEAENARRERFEAQLAQKEAQMQRDRAEFQRLLADKQKQQAEAAQLRAEKSESAALASKVLADAEKEKSYALRMLSLSREMAIKSTHMMDKNLKGLVALQAYQFHQQYSGQDFQPENYQALYQADQVLGPSGSNSTRNHNKVINQLGAYQNQIISISDDQKLGITHASNLSDYQEFVRPYPITAFLIDENEHSLVLGSSKGNLTKLDLSNGKIVWERKMESEDLLGIFSINEAYFFFGTGGMVSQYSHSGELLSHTIIGFIPKAIAQINQQFWISDGQGKISMFSSSLDQIGSFKPDNSQAITSMVFHNQSEQLAIGYQSGLIFLIDPLTKVIKEALPGHSAAITDLSFNNDGNYLLSGSFDRSIRLWNIKRPEKAPIVLRDSESEQWIKSVTFSSDSKHFYSGSFDGTLSRYYLSMDELSQGLCDRISRNMTIDEWETHVAEDIVYQKTCPDE